MLKRYRKWAVLAFAAWYLITAPAQATDLVKQAASGVVDAAEALATFISAIP